MIYLYEDFNSSQGAFLLYRFHLIISLLKKKIQTLRCEFIEYLVRISQKAQF